MRSALYKDFKANSKRKFSIILTISLLFPKLDWFSHHLLLIFILGRRNQYYLRNFDQFLMFYFGLVFKIRYFNIQVSAICVLISILSAFTSWLNYDLNTTKNVVKILVRFISALGFTRLMVLILKLVYYKTPITMPPSLSWS